MNPKDDAAGKAKRLINRRIILAEAAFAELVLWELPGPNEERSQGYKYRLALIVDGGCVMRFDNERGTGDHYQFGDVEQPYEFKDIDQVITDFVAKVKELMNANDNS